MFFTTIFYQIYLACQEFFCSSTFFSKDIDRRSILDHTEDDTVNIVSVYRKIMKKAPRIIKRIISTVCFPFLCLSLFFAGAGRAAEPERVKSINHRGYSKVAPENTLPAFELSREKGFEYVEADVSFTKDGVPVLLHDAKINRTARNEDGSKLKKGVSINNITYEEALAYDFGIWKGKEFKGTKIPSFDEFLQLCKELHLHPYVELKENGAYTRDQIELLVEIAEEKDLQKDITWISFSEKFLSWVRDRDPEARLGLLERFLFSVDDYERTIIIAKNLQTEYNEVFLDVNMVPLLYDEHGTNIFISMCWEAGLPLEVWTVDQKDIVRNLDPYISGVTTNKLLYSEVINEEE